MTHDLITKLGDALSGYERLLVAANEDRDKLRMKLNQVREITNTYGNTEDKLRAIEKVVHE